MSDFYAMCGEPYLIGTDDRGERIVMVARCHRLRDHDGKHASPYMGGYMFWWIGDPPAPLPPEAP